MRKLLLLLVAVFIISACHGDYNPTEPEFTQSALRAVGPVLTYAEFVNGWTLRFAFEESPGSESSIINPETVSNSDFILTLDGEPVPFNINGFHWGWYFNAGATRADGIWEFTVLPNSVIDGLGNTNPESSTLTWEQIGDQQFPFDPIDPGQRSLWRIRWGYGPDPSTWTSGDREILQCYANMDSTTISYPCIEIPAQDVPLVYFQVQFRYSPEEPWGADYPGEWSEVAALYTDVVNYDWPHPYYPHASAQLSQVETWNAPDFPDTPEYRFVFERKNNNYGENKVINWWYGGSWPMVTGCAVTVDMARHGGGEYHVYAGYRDPQFIYPEYQLVSTSEAFIVRLIKADRPDNEYDFNNP